MDICEKCGFYCEVTENKSCTVEQYCELLNCLVDENSCKCVKFVFDKVFDNEYVKREESCKLMRLLWEQLRKYTIAGR